MSFGILFCEPRREAWAVENLTQLKFEASYPVLNTTRIVRHKKVNEAVPALRRYVFVREQHSMPWGMFKRVPGVVCVLSIAGKPCTIRDAELDRLNKVVQEMNDGPPPAPFDVGDTVKFNEETLFQDFLGVVQRLDANAVVVDIQTNLGTRRLRLPPRLIARAAVSPAVAVSMGLYR